MNVRARTGIGLIVALTVTALSLTRTDAQQRATVAIDPDDIGGVVTSAKGPEAGVWVVAETSDLPTKFARIVVTDDQGRYVVPDLPKATYDLFVRGYGLVDSPKVKSTPGQHLDLKAVVAPDARAAAQVYPAGWWFSMMELPQGAKEQEDFQKTMRGCMDCHHLGDKATREIEPALAKMSSSTLDAWERRVKFGPSSSGMSADFMRLGEGRKKFAEWTDRIAKGEVPKTAPPRPTGVERNLVLTLWDWGSPLDGRADNVASDRRNARVNPNGLVFGASQMTDALNVLDPKTNKVSITPGHHPCDFSESWVLSHVFVSIQPTIPGLP